jgi:16S rRNA processing protein RimM
VNEYYLVGKVDAVFGDKGFVKIIPYTDFAGRFYELNVVFLDFWGDKKRFYIEKTETRKNTLSVKFKNFNDQRDSQVLLGREIFIEENDLIELPENHFFIHDLIGSKVIVNDEKIGEVEVCIESTG